MVNVKVETNMEAQYQTVNVRRVKEPSSSTSTGVEEILKKIVPAKSFLYRHQTDKVERDKVATSYVPMNAGTPKPRKLFRLSSFTHPDFDIKHFRLSKTENFNDRGYYQVKTNTKTYMQQKSSKKADTGTKYKSLTSIEDIEKFSDEHFYEDLNYYDMDKADNQPKDTNSAHSSFNSRMVKIHDMFTSFKLPFLKRAEDLEKDNKIVEDGSKIEENSHNKIENMKPNECDKCGHIYENSDSVANMYDSIHVNPQENKSNEKLGLPVEDYLEPVQLNKDYCDVAPAPKDDSILRYILNIFEHLSMKRETTDMPSEDPAKSQTEKEKPLEEKPRSSMADRPLPVPVENEPYFMNIDRTEAENLLRGQPDGTFILRPSSQSDHAYTLSVSCANAVHNVGVRRRQDGRLALGFARRGERSFDGVTSLLRHHRKQRLLLVAGGSVCGATALIGSPEYYQTPKKLTRAVDSA